MVLKEILNILNSNFLILNSYFIGAKRLSCPSEKPNTSASLSTSRDFMNTNHLKPFLRLSLRLSLFINQSIVKTLMPLSVMKQAMIIESKHPTMMIRLIPADNL